MAVAETRRIAVLAAGQSPTRELYLDQRLVHTSAPVHHWALGTDCPCPADGTFVIIVRYLDARATAWLRRNRDRLAGIALLIDDDIPGAIGDGSLPRNYRLKLARYWWRFRRALFTLCDEVWASSPPIVDRLRALGFARPIEIIDPLYCGPPLPRPSRPADPGRPVEVFYHGLPTHTVECLWLRDVVAEVQRRRDDVLFEIIGRTDIKRAFSNLPRVRVVHPMTYDAYKAYMAVQQFDLGLAPLLDTVFNQSRSCTKAYDVASVGAVGLYADSAVYRGVIRHDENGLLLPMDKAAWADALCALAGDPDRRDRLRAATRHDGARTPPLLARLSGTGT